MLEKTAINQPIMVKRITDTGTNIWIEKLQVSVKIKANSISKICLAYAS